MTVVSPYRLTAEDLPDLDSKTRRGVGPLLDALNVTLPQLVAAVAESSPYVDVTLAVGATVADSFPLLFRHSLQTRPRFVALANVRPRDPDHALTTPFVSQGFGLTDNGLVSVQWVTGVIANNTYDLTFRVDG